ncbi:hypothetical protein PINS_up006658 [Pythium insidiosum]|nr:hypothetical protein PINS_up006658 [Pythium insidiosum]
MKAMAAFSGDDSMFDAVVLHTLKQNRTTYLGLKWKLSRTPGGNRDMCFIEYVGVANDSKGQRFGFRVIESVKLRHCPPFDDNSIIRTDLSFCYLFRETGTPGLVDVFMQGAFDSSADVVTAGGVGDARSTMEMLLSVESCMERAEAKKLGELVAKQAQQPPRPQSGSPVLYLPREARAAVVAPAVPGLRRRDLHQVPHEEGDHLQARRQAEGLVLQDLPRQREGQVAVRRREYPDAATDAEEVVGVLHVATPLGRQCRRCATAGVALDVQRVGSVGHRRPPCAPHDARARAVGQEQARAPAHDRRLAQ